MALEKFKLLASKLPNIFYYPLIGCLACMSSIWGITVYIALNGFSMAQMSEIFICCVSAAFTNFLFKEIYDAVGR